MVDMERAFSIRLADSADRNCSRFGFAIAGKNVECGYFWSPREFRGHKLDPSAMQW